MKEKKLNAYGFFGLIIAIVGYYIIQKHDGTANLMEWTGIAIFGLGIGVALLGLRNRADPKQKNNFESERKLLGKILLGISVGAFILLLYFGLTSVHTWQWISVGTIILLLGVPLGLLAYRVPDKS